MVKLGEILQSLPPGSSWTSYVSLIIFSASSEVGAGLCPQPLSLSRLLVIGTQIMCSKPLPTSCSPQERGPEAFCLLFYFFNQYCGTDLLGCTVL